MIKFIWFIRKLLAMPIGLIYSAVWLFKYATNESIRAVYKINKADYDKIKRLPDLIDYLKKVKYVWDGPKGIFDHNNSDIEYFVSGGDCEDTAMRAYRKMKGFNIKCGLVLIIGEGNGDVHVDCVYKTGLEYCLFNFGLPILSLNIESLVKLLWINHKNNKIKMFGIVESKGF